MKPINGTTPVPGPTMMIGVSGLAGILKADGFMKALTVEPINFSEFARSSKKADIKPCRVEPFSIYQEVSEIAIARSFGWARLLEAIV